MCVGRANVRFSRGSPSPPAPLRLGPPGGQTKLRGVKGLDQGRVPP